MDYCDEAEILNTNSSETNTSSAFSFNKFHIEGVSFYSVEFPAEARTVCRFLNDENKESSCCTDEHLTNVTKPIIIAKLGGRQEVRLKLKNGENIQGPKVDLEMNLGSLSVFLSPRQFHLLQELRYGIATPHIQDDSNVVRCTQKAMEAGDYDRVEQQLMSHLQPVSNKGLHSLQGWSSAPLDDSDEEFLPVRGADNSLMESVSSEADSLNMSSSSYSVNSKPTSSIDNSTLFNLRHESQKEKKRHAASTSTDMGIEECHMNIRLNSLAVVLLHEDILVISPETGQLTTSSTLQMEQTAEEFFRQVGLLATSGYGKKDSEFAKKLFIEACQMNHIRVFAAPIFLESDEKHLTSSTVVNAVLTAACVEVLECLVDPASKVSPNYIELLKFDLKQTATNSEVVPAQTDVRIHIKRVIKRNHLKMSMQRQLSDAEILLYLQICCLELDFSIVDRISAIINYQPLCSQSNVFPEKVDLYGICQPVDLTTSMDSKTHLKITSPHFLVKLRFPIPDLRPLYDMDRPPWWKRNVHKDILYLHFHQVTLKTVTEPGEDLRTYEVFCKTVNLLFQEGEGNTEIPIAYAEADIKSNQSDSDYIRFVLKVKSLMQQAGLNEEYLPELPTTATTQGSFYIETKCDLSPFSTKRVIHKSDTSHESSQCDGDELITPADRAEMERFVNATSKNSNIIVDINLPKANVYLPSKHLYEVLYNRLSTDLSLWKPSHHMASGFSNEPSIQPELTPHFSMCRSPIHCESDSESDEGKDVFYSMWDIKPNHLKKSSNEKCSQSNMAVSVTLGMGTFCFITDVKVPDCKPTQQAIFQINLKEAFLFTASSIHCIPHQNSICAQINNFSLSHINLIKDENFDFNLKSFSSVENCKLDPVLYKTEKGAMVNCGPLAAGTGCDNSMDMFTIALSSHVDNSRMKMVRVACGIRDITLRHRVTYTHQSWLMQLLGFFDIMDYPVPGYEPSQVITELHQHFWNCAIDYRPLNLAMRSLLSIGSLSISSNMAAHTSSSTLYFIAEDAYFFISDKLSPKVELRLDYVCIIDLGLFELSLRMSDQPRVDLRASNNVLHIRTCSDSAQLLAQLIVYLASYGDLDEVKPTQDTPAESTSILLSDSTVQRVNTLMEDAMIDDLRDGIKTIDANGQKAPGVELFYFPDENLRQLKKTYPCQRERIDVSSHAVDLSDVVREEYVIVEHEAGSGVLRGSSLPEVRVLTITPIGLRENHFSKPTGETDFLKAPLNFPLPVYKYTLREMTLLWFMYGGLDFTNEHPKKHVTICSESGSTPTSPAYKRTTNIDVNYSKTCPQQVNFNRQSSIDECFENAGYKKPMSKQCWWTRGGIGRQHDVLMELQLNKVRFQHEVYPDKTSQASRQVLLIQEFDVRDRLAISKINKFLYQYTSEAMPKQSHANMLVVKATHLRPDPQILRQECCLRVSLMPLRLNIDQDALLFLITFANEVAGVQGKEEVEVLVPGSPQHLPPVMGIGIKGNSSSLIPQSKLLFKLNDQQNKSEIITPKTATENSSSSSPIFFRRFEFSPEVPIRLDYEGKHVDLKHGPLAGLLMGLAQLNCSELRLKRLSHRHGILGFEKLLAFIMSEWINDIKKNQLPSLLGGVGPIYSVVQLFQGIRDLFWLPIEQYQRDGRIVRGLQRGANSFTTSTALAALELTSRIVHAIQSVAETAFDMVSPGPSVRRRKSKHGHRSRSRYTPPADFREGITNAVALVKEGIGDTAHTLFQEALAEHEDKGAFGAVGGVLRQIPPTMVTPIILASAATSNLLGGVRNQLVPDAHREDTLKWRDNDNSKSS